MSKICHAQKEERLKKDPAAENCGAIYKETVP